MLRDAGAVLLAKLTTGELAQGDQWFGGQTRTPGTTGRVERVVGGTGVGNRRGTGLIRDR